MTNELIAAADTLIKLAFEEDLASGLDITSETLIEKSESGSARIVARENGILCGQFLVPQVIRRFAPEIDAKLFLSDGDIVKPGVACLEVSGPAISLLKTERTILNFLGRLSGVSTLTNRYVKLVAGTKAKIFDTRKTIPGWRRLEKYAVKCGGGENHRMGLFDAVLIKDNHLAMLKESTAGETNTSWVQRVKLAFEKIRCESPDITVQIEVDTIKQLEAILPLTPDIVLLDNMSNEQLSAAVELRGSLPIELEASGGVNLETVAEIAQTGVERISIGAITHSAINFDWGMDWN